MVTKMKLFEGKSVSEVWDKSYNCLFEEINNSRQDSRIGKTVELMKVGFTVTNSRDRWILNRQPMISPAFAIAEIFWILDGRNKSNFINTWNPLMKKYSGDTENYYGAYGERLKYNFDINQIEQAYDTLSRNPNSRQAVLQIWDVKKDLPKIDGKPNSEDIPCNISSILKIRNNKLEWSQIMRGNDLFRGTPYNFIQFTTLQEIMAGWLNIDIGEYFYFTDSLHIYESDLNKFTKRKDDLFISNNDKLLFNKKQFDKFFPKCMEILDKVKNDGVKEDDIINLKNCNVIPQEYKNLLSLPLAYLSLKSNDLKLVSELEQLCTNKLLLTVWNLWKEERYKTNKYLEKNSLP